MTTYRTSDGDMLDRICLNVYGTANGTVEAVLAANRGLAQQPSRLPAGIIIVLPDQNVPVEEQELDRLWDNE